jgi:hypothetical protein
MGSIPCGRPGNEAVDKPVLDHDGHSINSDKSISGLNLGNSQGVYANCSLLYITSQTIYR